MSTGLECAFIETQPNTWYYILEQGGAPKNASNWQDHADCFGPFVSLEAGHDHLRTFHANPGGFSVGRFEAGREADPALEELVARATAPHPHREPSLRGRDALLFAWALKQDIEQEKREGRP